MRETHWHESKSRPPLLIWLGWNEGEQPGPCSHCGYTHALYSHGEILLCSICGPRVAQMIHRMEGK